MNLLMLTFILCGLLTSVTKAGWGVKQCWKNNVGHCRRRCLDTERYKILCMNKQNCCIPINFEEYTGKPLLPTDFPTNVTGDVFPASPGTRPDDAVTFNPGEGSSVRVTRTPRKTSTPALAPTTTTAPTTAKKNSGATN
uniref:Beta-defensin n=1 Tax=Myotis myotis TaxID=51298 RepID=A0A7J7VXU4_MYOMY|nr:defensin beta 125 [Myotis myotis]